MGTRGAVVLVASDNEKSIYNHWGSSPSGLGEGSLTWLRAALKDEAGTRAAVGALAPVPEGDPTAADFERLAEFHDPSVDTGKSWYSLLRHTQGDLAATLRAGLYEDAGDFPLDSLFCEWAYVVDFDVRTFAVYQGFQKTPPTLGRWVGKAGLPDNQGYEPVQRIAEYGFDDLPITLADDKDD